MASDRNKIVAAASRCLSCESSRSALMGAIAKGFQSCCPDCDTLTLPERNRLRELLAAAVAAERARVAALVNERIGRTHAPDAWHVLVALRDELTPTAAGEG